MKTYVLDTNVLLHNPQSLYAFDDNRVVVPLLVVEEIDDQKRRNDEVGRNAREVSRILDGFREQGHLSDGITLPSGGVMCVEINHHEYARLPKGVDRNKTDNLILAVCLTLQAESDHDIILVTKDLNLRIKADVCGIRAEDFYNDKVDFDSLYTGVSELAVPGEMIDAFYAEGGVDWDGPDQFKTNQFLVLSNEVNPKQTALARFREGRLVPLIYGKAIASGIKARNKEQQFAMELLMDQSIPVVTLAGRAGTGKTLLAVAAGLEQTMESADYKRLLITRPVTPMGEDIGFLPGGKEEKLRPWMQPLYDNMEFIFSRAEDTKGMPQQLQEMGILEMEALTYIRGRSIPNQFIVCDEAQNLTPHMVKTLITRVGEGAKIVFTGDPEQIDHPYLDASSNGLTFLVERLKGEEIAGHITLVKGERSTVAELAAELL